MSLSEEVERLLPRLRRFARASTADETLADNCVAAAIERLTETPVNVADRNQLPDDAYLYHAVERELEKQAGGGFKKQAWRALVLLFVEGFSEHETGRILGVDVERVRVMVTSAEEQVHIVLSGDGNN